MPTLFRGRRPQAGEIAFDRAQADRLGIGLGDTVSVLGTPLRVAGEVEGMDLIVGSFAFVAQSTLQRIARTPDVVSYVLVAAEKGADEHVVARRIEEHVPRVTASTRASFAASERRVVGDMTTDIIRGMVFVGFVIGVAVAGLVAYGAVLAQLRDFAVLRALGLPARNAVRIVVAQIGATVAAGFALALALVFLLGLLLPRLSPSLVLDVRPEDVVQGLAVAGAVALVAAALPVMRVANVDPASVFRR